jgi:hypothetical protein
MTWPIARWPLIVALGCMSGALVSVAAHADTTTPARDLPADAVALSGTWGGYIHDVGAGNGRFQLTYRGGVPDIEKLTPLALGTGVGVLEGPIAAKDPRWDQVRKVICEGTNFGAMSPGNSLTWGSARCASGEFKSASADPVVGGKDAKALASVFGGLLTDYYSQGLGLQGHRVAWLEAETYIAPAGDRLKVTLRLINSGKEDIVVESPEQWRGIDNPMARFTVLGVGAHDDLGHKFRLPHLGSSALAQGQNFPDGGLIVPAGQHRDIVFLSYTEEPFGAGSYTIGGSLNFLHVLAPDSLKGSVQMWLRQTTGNRFEHDYPANDADLSQLEAARREREASLPALTIDTKVEEGGWYRAARKVDGKEQRSDVPRLFHTGDVLPAESLVHLASDGSHDAGTATGWRWEAYIQAQVTGHPRERCPRSGL